MSLSKAKKLINADDLLQDGSVCEGIKCKKCSMLARDVNGVMYCRVIKWVEDQKGMYVSMEVPDERSKNP